MAKPGPCVDRPGFTLGCRLLVGPLARFFDPRLAAGLFGFGFLLRRVTLRLGLVLLGLAFFGEVVAAGDGANDLFGPAFDVLDDTLDSFCGATVVVSH